MNLQNHPKDRQYLFAAASTLPLKENKFLNEKERLDHEMFRILSGTKNIKRRLLGLCGTSAIKSLEEITQVLSHFEIVENIEESKSLIEDLLNERLVYQMNPILGGYTYLHIEKVSDLRNITLYRVSTRRYKPEPFLYN